jgi:hypothetical protein
MLIDEDKSIFDIVDKYMPKFTVVLSIITVLYFGGHILLSYMRG